MSINKEVIKMNLNPQLPEFEISFKTKAKASELFTVKSSNDIANVCRLAIDSDKIEWIESMVVIGFYKVSQGGVTGTVADPKVILQFALLSNSTALIICHNHPSGNLQPSKADEDLTEKIKKACSYFDIKLLDHIILTTEDFFSFADNGYLY